MTTQKHFLAGISLSLMIVVTACSTRQPNTVYDNDVFSPIPTELEPVPTQAPIYEQPVVTQPVFQPLPIEDQSFYNCSVIPSDKAGLAFYRANCI